MTYVVTAEQSADWVMETDSPERAFQDAHEDVSRLGPQRKSDLAGSQGSDRIEFFRWPLTDGLSWTTQWDDRPVTITAHVTSAQAHLQAVDANGTKAYEYTYDPKVGWMRDMKRFAPDGSELFAGRLTASGHNWTGNVARWDLDAIVARTGTLASPANEHGTFEVPLAATDVWASLHLSCTTGTLNLGVAPMPVVTTMATLEPRGVGGGGGEPCPAEIHFTDSAGAPKAPVQGGTSETWAWSVKGVPGGVGTYSLEVLVRTLEMAPVS